MIANSELRRFNENYKNDELNKYYDKLYDKICGLKDRMNKLTIYELVIFIVFYLNLRSTLQPISFMGINFSDFKLIPVVTPILFIFFLYEYSLLSIHALRIKQALKFRFDNDITRNSTTEDPKEIPEYFFNLLMPFSFSMESTKIFKKKEFWLLRLSLSPVLFLFFPPLFFSLKMITNLYSKLWVDSLFTISFFISLWLLFITILNYYIFFRDTFRLAAKNEFSN